MQRNILLEIEYLGTNYFGFQIQNKKNKTEITIQSALEGVLFRLLKQKVKVTSAGRTDRGVHAKAQIVNFKIDNKIPLSNFKTALNAHLPPDIRIKRIKKVSADFHARFWAKSKIYRYVILTQKEPSAFWYNLVWQIKDKLDIELMQKAAKRIRGKRDFSVFAKEAKKYKDCVRDIKEISIKKRGSFIYIDIEADGFLRSMARNIVAFLVKAAAKNLPLGKVSSLLAGKTVYLNEPAPAGGLYLYKVVY